VRNQAAAAQAGNLSEVAHAGNPTVDTAETPAAGSVPADDRDSDEYEPPESLYEPPGSVSSGGYVSPAATDGLGSLGDVVSSDSDGLEDPFLVDAP
jgi:hypothetical protein